VYETSAGLPKRLACEEVKTVGVERDSTWSIHTISRSYGMGVKEAFGSQNVIYMFCTSER